MTSNITWNFIIKFTNLQSASFIFCIAMWHVYFRRTVIPLAFLVHKFLFSCLSILWIYFLFLLMTEKSIHNITAVIWLEYCLYNPKQSIYTISTDILALYCLIYLSAVTFVAEKLLIRCKTEKTQSINPLIVMVTRLFLF